jgi:hypothetical protein
MRLIVRCAPSYLERVYLVHVSFSETVFNRASVQADDAQSAGAGFGPGSSDAESKGGKIERRVQE